MRTELYHRPELGHAGVKAETNLFLRKSTAKLHHSKARAGFRISNIVRRTKRLHHFKVVWKVPRTSRLCFSRIFLASAKAPLGLNPSAVSLRQEGGFLAESPAYIVFRQSKGALLQYSQVRFIGSGIRPGQTSKYWPLTLHH